MLHRAVRVHHVDVGGTDERGGDDRRAEPGRRPSDRSVQGVQVAARFGLMIAGTIGIDLPAVRATSCWRRSASPIRSSCASGASCCGTSSVSGLFITVALTLHGRTAGNRRHAQSAVHHAGRAGRGSARPVLLPSGHRPAQATGIWLAIVLGHFTRCVLVGRALPPGTGGRRSLSGSSHTVPRLSHEG